MRKMDMRFSDEVNEILWTHDEKVLPLIGPADSFENIFSYAKFKDPKQT